MADNLWLAMVAVRGDDAPPGEAMIEQYRSQWPDLPPPNLSNSGPRVATLSFDDAAAAVTQVPMPIPWTQIEGPCEAAWYWPGATEAMRDHQTHLLITLLDEGRSEIDKSMRLTRLTSVVARTSDAAGIVWGPSRLVHDVEAFSKLAGEMTRQHLPLYLWVDFRVQAQPDGSLVLFTTGLEALGREELEVAGYAGQPQRLVENVYNVAHYQIDKHGAIKDGDTIGLADGVRITARHAPSLCDADKQVLRLDFAGDTA
ncbi:MAG: DUF4261 domain-containing protein [Pirellulales bacterium]